MKKFENLNIDDIIVILLYYHFMLSDKVVNIKIQKPYNYSRALLFIKRQKKKKSLVYGPGFSKIPFDHLFILYEYNQISYSGGNVNIMFNFIIDIIWFVVAHAGYALTKQ